MTVFCPKCGAANEDVATYCASCGESMEEVQMKKAKAEKIATATDEQNQTQDEDQKESTTGEKKLYRSRTNKIVSGLSAGMADYFGIEVDLMRLLWLIAIFVSGTSLVILYLILWAAIPLEPEQPVEAEKSS